MLSRSTTESSPESQPAADPLPPHDASTVLALQHVTRCLITNLPVVTPLIAAAWHRHLTGYPDRSWAHRLVHDILCGVDIGYRGSRQQQITCPNFIDSEAEERAVTADLQNEISLGRIAGPFTRSPFQHFRCSPLKTVEKKGKPGQYRVIHHLSHPHGRSINTYTADWPCHLARLDDALNIVRRLGRGCCMAKMDVKSAYRIIPVRPADWSILGIYWQQRFFFHRTLPFGLRSSCHLWERYATAVQWIITNILHIDNITHYVDDFFLAALRDHQCGDDLRRTKSIWSELGVPDEAKKTEGPSTRLVFLGILIDSEAMSISLHQTRLAAIRTTLRSWQQRTTCSLRQLQSIIGVLSFASMVVRHGRTFLQHMRDAATTYNDVDDPHDTTVVPLSADFQEDITWWYQFMAQWNGVSLLWDTEWMDTSDILQPHTDACVEGYAAVCGKEWFHARWTEGQRQLAQDASMTRDSMPWKELYAIVAAAATWGQRWSRRKVIFYTDCMPVVQALNKGASRTRRMMQLIRILHFHAARYSFVYSVQHLPGADNAIADELSRVFDVTQLSPTCRGSINPLPITPVLPLIPP
jgi:hypothetical protein